jgi:putative heme-binding domain-containing protein
MPKAELPVEPPQSKWSYEELLSYLTGDAAPEADPVRGAVVFEQAQCVKCHRFGGRGASVGPDLTTVSRRFQKKEILQSIIFPSHVISDQYASQKVLTTDGRVLTGIAAPAGQEAIALIGADGHKTLLRSDQIEDIQFSAVSVMPEGLLDGLTLEQIADLFAYLNHPPRQNITSRRGATPR